ncbi:MAG: hypothetical protein H6Q68_1545 [Firmicutes bacterium]|nr:hypothetical protein [Bacillota bacterium]
MKYLSKFPYAKPAGISFLLHSALIVCLAMLGPPYLVDKTAEITAIEVFIDPAVMIDKEDEIPPAPADFSPSASTERLAPNLTQITARTESFSPALPGEISDTSVAKVVSSGTEVVEQMVSVGSNREKSNVGEGASNNHGGGGRTSPNYLYGPKPDYPQAARKARWEGAVAVRVRIDVDGSVTMASVKEGSGYDILDEAAVQAVKKWRFSPATKGGVPVASSHDVRVRFRLDEIE